MKARQNVSRGSWKQGIDEYTEQDDAQTLSSLDQYDYTRKHFKR